MHGAGRTVAVYGCLFGRISYSGCNDSSGRPKRPPCAWARRAPLHLNDTCQTTSCDSRSTVGSRPDLGLTTLVQLTPGRHPVTHHPAGGLSPEACWCHVHRRAVTTPGAFAGTGASELQGGHCSRSRCVQCAGQCVHHGHSPAQLAPHSSCCCAKRHGCGRGVKQ